jgi:hypothetical protein
VLFAEPIQCQRCARGPVVRVDHGEDRAHAGCEEAVGLLVALPVARGWAPIGEPCAKRHAAQHLVAVVLHAVARHVFSLDEIEIANARHPRIAVGADAARWAEAIGEGLDLHP